MKVGKFVDLPLISVIIPVYQVEKYLNKCIDSVVGQTYKNLEIILVDDGSTDLCPKICDEWKKKDDRIKVIHKKNGGLSDARNEGLKEATGEYIGFVDSDDFIAPVFYELLYEIIVKESADIVECDRKIGNGSETIEESFDEDINYSYNSFSREDALKKLILEKELKQTVWNKLYRKDIIEGITFEKGKLHEDEFFTYRVFGRAKKIISLDSKLYYYLQRDNSIMGAGFSVRNIDSLEARYNRYQYMKKEFPALAEMAQESAAWQCLYLYQRALMCNDVNVKKVSKKVLCNYWRKISCDSKVKNSNIKFTHKIWFKLADRSLEVCCRVRNLLKIGL